VSVTKVRISSRVGAAEALGRLFGDGRVQGIAVVGFGHDGNICGVAVNSQHRALSWVKVWELASLAAELEVRDIVLAVFPSGRAPTPSAHELAVFSDLLVRTRRAGFVLLDCLVFRGDRFWSLRELRDQADL
jgi:hypothetical protein